MLTSPIIIPRLEWDELVLSWNALVPRGTGLRAEARVLYPQGPTKYYTLGLWSTDPGRYPRQSVRNQADAAGDVLTDTLTLKHPATRLQVRLTLTGLGDQIPKCKFLGVSLKNTQFVPPVLPPNQRAWGKTIPVPKLTQLIYPNGGVLCSPTTVSMLLAYWAKQRNRPDLDLKVPEIAKEIYDSQWEGTGNWAFNMAFAGSLRGMRAYATRFTDLTEVENWIACGVPVGLSLCYDRLRKVGQGPNGHLVVCVGFTLQGNPILNDPARAEQISSVFPRSDLVYAWAHSKNTVYLIYPETWKVPTDRFAHWDSAAAQLRFALER